ncbi:YceI family protein [Taibaiella sp. KBW10]|uniref:YceI family protein n=1 Tax=Taibaiella sp. KBW10 TaxID=2153357 RepID=UPI000F5B2C02|nr:YceI family protein [Taibaiella sp. KBW10]RQO31897.1 YceI family protein [Taibaiella sp. KBW10]
MKKIICSALLISGMVTGTYAQKFFTNKGTTQFYSSTPVEDIKATNKQTSALLNTDDKSLVCVMENTKFIFPKSLMQEHFNENYMESTKYPKSTFTGTYDQKIDASVNGKYNVTVSGKLSIHGVLKSVSMPATIEVKNGQIIGHCVFKVKTKDYNIKIPTLVVAKVAEDIQVTIDFIATKM